MSTPPTPLTPAAEEQSLDTPYAPLVTLDRASKVPLYRQISLPLERLILSGEVAPGRLIEDEVSMATRLEVSRLTARRALQEMVKRGLLNRRRGAGTRVTPAHVHRALGLTSLNDDLVKAGFHPRTEVLSYEVKFATAAEAGRLACAEGAEIIRLRRRRHIDSGVLALMTNLLPADIAPTLAEVSSKGLYACLAEHETRPASALQTLSAVNADATEAAQLGLQPGDALLTMERTAYDHRGRVIEFAAHRYNAALFSFSLRLLAE